MEEAFEGWYAREHPCVLGVLVALSGEVDLARDATDEAFVRALERWSRVQTMESPGAWVYTVALNCLRRTVRRARFERLLLRRRPVQVGPEPTAYPEVWSAVRTLPVRQRLAVVLRYVSDLPESQMAEIMGVSRGTVASTLAAARRRLGLVLDQEPQVAEVDHA
jgi:RNA polymerase sigma-70 factor (ECF subfamily)